MGSRSVRILSVGVEAGVGPMPEEPVKVTCGGSSPAMRGSNRFWISRMRSATGPDSSAIRTMPDFMNGSSTQPRQHREAQRPNAGFGNHGEIHEPFVDT